MILTHMASAGGCQEQREQKNDTHITYTTTAAVNEMLIQSFTTPPPKISITMSLVPCFIICP